MGSPLFILVFLLAGSPLFAAEPKSVVSEFQAIVGKQAQSAAMNGRADRALRSLDPKKGRGWALVDTSRFFPAEMMSRFYASLGRLSRVDAQTNHIFDQAGEGGDDEVKTLTPEQMAPLMDYVTWLKKSLNRALGPAEELEIAHCEVHITASAKKRPDYGPWHVDDDYLSAVVTLMGGGPQYFADGPKLTPSTFAGYMATAEKRKDARTLARGHTLIWSGAERATAQDSVRPNIHRIPPQQDRVFLVVRFARKGPAPSPPVSEP